MPNQVKLFDSHCHLDMPQFKGKVSTLVEKCEETGIGGILIPGVTREGWLRIRQITARVEICHTALGLHPMFIDQHEETHLHDLEMALSVGPIAAIGEIGLDYYKAGVNRDLQLRYFTAQVDIAKDARLPIVLHVRKAHDQVLQILKKSHFALGGIVHAFNGSENQAERYVELGFKLGFGGAMTFPRAAKLHKLAKNLPLESIVLETDAPDMKPVTCKQAYNTPLHLFDNFRSLISMREEPAAVIAKQTTQNVHTVLNLD
ncbi:TatD family hydrolase [Aliikangiella coralliicola]|uniref:TatD family deoxyribonuclease n=1 Tax=Aliikangiella coralliicola TaxID=2592383 RepID=A0A545UAH4_9GAMM|nr:TatD family hydrolase [Aliikangiella coralliicola]TQV86466.1 TatD family deoxyribonuclease [Aliikangiella coralliicola]